MYNLSMSTLTHTPEFLFDEQGQKTSVLLPIEIYEKLMAHWRSQENDGEQEVEKLRNLVHRPHVIIGDPEDLPDIHWEVNLDLP